MTKGELYKKKLFNIYILRKYITIILKNENTTSFNKVILELFKSYFPLKDMANIKNLNDFYDYVTARARQ